MGWLQDILNIFKRKPVVTPPPPPPPPPDPPATVDWRASLLDLHNQVRSVASRAPLTLSNKLNVSAGHWANQMALGQDLQHESGGNTVESRATSVGYVPWATLGENIAAGYATLSALADGWENSPAHYRNMIGNFKEVGFGKAYDTNNKPYWVADFGSIASASATNPNTLREVASKIILSGPLHAENS